MRIERIEQTSDTYKDKDKSAFITENMTGSASSFIRTHPPAPATVAMPVSGGLLSPHATVDTYSENTIIVILFTNNDLYVEFIHEPCFTEFHCLLDNIT